MQGPYRLLRRKESPLALLITICCLVLMHSHSASATNTSTSTSQSPSSSTSISSDSSPPNSGTAGSTPAIVTVGGTSVEGSGTSLGEMQWRYLNSEIGAGARFSQPPSMPSYPGSATTNESGAVSSGYVHGAMIKNMQAYSLQPYIPSSAINYLTPSKANEYEIYNGNPGTTGAPLTDSAYYILTMKVLDQTLAKATAPERVVPAAQATGQAIAISIGNAAAQAAQQQAASAIQFSSSYVPNFTVDNTNQFNQLRNYIFVPMAILLLLPGVVLTQMKVTVAAGFLGFDASGPFEGLTRAIIAIFMIPGTYLVLNYGIDICNSITYTINNSYSSLNSTSLYQAAVSAEIRALPVRSASQNLNAYNQPTATMGPLTGNSTAFAQLEGLLIENTLQDPVAGIAITPPGRTDEALPASAVSTRLLSGITNAGLTAAWNVLCTFQVAYLYYLWFVGPIVAALWVWPMPQLRQALGSWVEGVVSLCFWSLFWNTSILLMACFKGVDETGTVMQTALNFLATASVQYAFNFAGLVTAAGQQAAGVVAGQAAQQAVNNSGGLAGMLGGLLGNVPLLGGLSNAFMGLINFISNNIGNIVSGMSGMFSSMFGGLSSTASTNASASANINLSQLSNALSGNVAGLIGVGPPPLSGPGGQAHSATSSLAEKLGQQVGLPPGVSGIASSALLGGAGGALGAVALGVAGNSMLGHHGRHGEHVNLAEMALLGGTAGAALGAEHALLSGGAPAGAHTAVHFGDHGAAGLGLPNQHPGLGEQALIGGAAGAIGGVALGAVENSMLGHHGPHGLHGPHVNLAEMALLGGTAGAALGAEHALLSGGAPAGAHTAVHPGAHVHGAAIVPGGQLSVGEQALIGGAVGAIGGVALGAVENSMLGHHGPHGLHGPHVNLAEMALHGGTAGAALGAEHALLSDGAPAGAHTAVHPGAHVPGAAIVPGGQLSVGEQALIGGAVGAIGGVALGAVENSMLGHHGPHGFHVPHVNVAEMAVIGGVAGAAIGAEHALLSSGAPAPTQMAVHPGTHVPGAAVVPSGQLSIGEQAIIGGAVGAIGGATLAAVENAAFVHHGPHGFHAPYVNVAEMAVIGGVAGAAIGAEHALLSSGAPAPAQMAVHPGTHVPGAAVVPGGQPSGGEQAIIGGAVGAIGGATLAAVENAAFVHHGPHGFHAPYVNVAEMAVIGGVAGAAIGAEHALLSSGAPAPTQMAVHPGTHVPGAAVVPGGQLSVGEQAIIGGAVGAIGGAAGAIGGATLAAVENAAFVHHGPHGFHAPHVNVAEMAVIGAAGGAVIGAEYVQLSNQATAVQSPGAYATIGGHPAHPGVVEHTLPVQNMSVGEQAIIGGAAGAIGGATLAAVENAAFVHYGPHGFHAPNVNVAEAAVIGAARGAFIGAMAAEQSVSPAASHGYTHHGTFVSQPAISYTTPASAGHPQSFVAAADTGAAGPMITGTLARMERSAENAARSYSQSTYVPAAAGAQSNIGSAPRQSTPTSSTGSAGTTQSSAHGTSAIPQPPSFVEQVNGEIRQELDQQQERFLQEQENRVRQQVRGAVEHASSSSQQSLGSQLTGQGTTSAQESPKATAASSQTTPKPGFSLLTSALGSAASKTPRNT